MTEKFLMVSLEDEQAKKLAEIISNKTSRRILDHLSNIEEASASDIAKKLNLPLNTIHYNIQNLVKSSLVECKEFKWSKKGREINLYKLAKKHIIITQKSDSLLKERLKAIFFVGVLSIIASFIIKLYVDTQSSVATTMKEAAPLAQQAKIAMDTQPEQIANLPTAPFEALFHNAYLWFLLGAIFAILIYTLILWRKERT